MREALERFFADNKRVGSEMDRAWQRQYGISLMEYQLFSASLAEGGIDFKTILSWAAPIGAGLGGAFIAMAVWARRLNREVFLHRKTETALREALAVLATESARRLAISHITLDLQQVRDAQEFGNILLSHLARQLSLGMGAFCLRETGGNRMVPEAQYAGTEESAPRPKTEALEGGSLLERCAATEEVIVVDGPKRLRLRIRSGLGNCSPAAIILYPIKHKGRLVAILELAPFVPVGEEGMDFLRELEPIVGIAAQGMIPARAPSNEC